MSFWCLQIYQKSNEIFLRISALASKKRLNQKKSLSNQIKKKVHFIALIRLFFLFDLFLEATGKNP